jgi:transposase InsO family protein
MQNQDGLRSKCHNRPKSTTTTTEMLFDTFAIHGYPYVMVSDNATIFVSDQFKSYCGQNGIFQQFIAPGHPATNCNYSKTWL